MVSYNVDGAREVVLDGVTGRLLPPQAVEGLAEAIVALARDPELRARMGRAGRRRCLEPFRAETMVRRLAELYRDLDRRQGARRRLSEGTSAGRQPSELMT